MIAGLNSDSRYVVLNEHTLGVSTWNGIKIVVPISVSIIRGAVNDGTHGSICINHNDTVRDATLDDFDTFRCCVSPDFYTVNN